MDPAWFSVILNRMRVVVVDVIYCRQRYRFVHPTQYKWKQNIGHSTVLGGGVLSKIITYPPPSPLSSHHKTFYNTRIVRKLVEIRGLKPDSPTLNTVTVWRNQISLLCSNLPIFVTLPIYGVTDFLSFGFFDLPIFRFSVSPKSFSRSFLRIYFMEIEWKP